MLCTMKRGDGGRGGHTHNRLPPHSLVGLGVGGRPSLELVFQRRVIARGEGAGLMGLWPCGVGHGTESASTTDRLGEHEWVVL